MLFRNQGKVKTRRSQHEGNRTCCSRPLLKRKFPEMKRKWYHRETWRAGHWFSSSSCLVCARPRFQVQNRRGKWPRNLEPQESMKRNTNSKYLGTWVPVVEYFLPFNNLKYVTLEWSFQIAWWYFQCAFLTHRGAISLSVGREGTCRKIPTL